MIFWIKSSKSRFISLNCCLHDHSLRNWVHQKCFHILNIIIFNNFWDVQFLLSSSGCRIGLFFFVTWCFLTKFDLSLLILFVFFHLFQLFSKLLFVNILIIIIFIVLFIIFFFLVSFCFFLIIFVFLLLFAGFCLFLLFLFFIILEVFNLLFNRWGPIIE